MDGTNKNGVVSARYDTGLLRNAGQALDEGLEERTLPDLVDPGHDALIN